MADISTDQTKLSPSEVAHAILAMRNTGISLYVHGAPGISKSAVARQVADKLGIAFIDFRLTSVAPEDVRGVPFMDDQGGIKGLVWTPPLVFPRDLNLSGSVDVTTSPINFYNPIGNNGIHYCKNPKISVQTFEAGKTAEAVQIRPDSFVAIVKNENGEIVPGKIVWTVTGKSEAILGLEEFNSAVPSVMAAAYQLILDRRIGDYVVPNGVMILAMGNRDGDKGVTFKLPKPVANRFVHIQMQHNFDDWQIWALENNIHPDVIGYLTKWTSHLFEEKFATIPDYSFATPRSWEFVSKIISQPILPPKPVLRALICGAIGNIVGIEFLSHREYMEDMPNVNSILNGSITTFEPKNPKYKTQIAYSTCVQMCHALKKESDSVDQKYKGNRLDIDKSPERAKLITKMNNALGYAMDNFSPEVLIVFNRMALQVYKLRFSSDKMPKYSEFSKNYHSSIIQ